MELDPGLIRRLNRQTVGGGEILVVVKDLVDHDVGLEDKGIRRARGWRAGNPPLPRTVRPPSAAAALDRNGVEHIGSRRAQQEEFVSAYRMESEQAVRESQATGGRQSQVGENTLAVSDAIAHDDAALQGEAVGAVVGQFDPEILIRRRRQFIEGQRHRGLVRGEILPAGGATDGVGEGPVPGRGACGVMVELGQRDAGAIGSDGPIAADAVVDFIHDTSGVVAEQELFAAVAEAAGEGAEEVGEAGGGGQVRWGRGDHDEAAPGDDGIGGEGVLDAAIERPAGDVEVHRHLVVELHPFQGGLVGGGMIHDLVEDQRGVGARDHCGKNQTVCCQEPLHGLISGKVSFRKKPGRLFHSTTLTVPEHLAMPLITDAESVEVRIAAGAVALSRRRRLAIFPFRNDGGRCKLGGVILATNRGEPLRAWPDA